MLKAAPVHVVSREFKDPKVILATEAPRAVVEEEPLDPRDHKEYRVRRVRGEPLGLEPEARLVQWAPEESVERWESKAKKVILVPQVRKVLVDAMVSRATVVLLVQWVVLVCVVSRETKVRKV